MRNCTRKSSFSKREAVSPLRKPTRFCAGSTGKRRSTKPGRSESFANCANPYDADRKLLPPGADLFGSGTPAGRDRLGAALGLQTGAIADQVGEDGDGAGVAEGGEAVEAEGVEVVAGEQGEVGVVA